MRVEWPAVGLVEDEVAPEPLRCRGALLPGAVAEGGGDAVGDGDPVLAAAGFGCGQCELVVVDRGERAAYIEDALVEVDVFPVQSEGFSLADAGADQ